MKDVLNFRNAAVFYDYTNIGITCELNQVRKCIISSFYKTKPDSKIRVSLSIIDDIFLKINKNDVDYFLEKNHDLRENILYMLLFKKLVRYEQQKVTEPILNDDE